MTNQQAARELRLSDAQRAVLHNLANGRPADYGISGRSAYGGLSRTITSLTSAGLIERIDESPWYRLTAPPRPTQERSDEG